MRLTGYNLYGSIEVQLLPWKHLLVVGHEGNLVFEHLKGLYWSLLQSQSSPRMIARLEGLLKILGCSALGDS